MELSQKGLSDNEIYEEIFKLENPSSADKVIPAKERKSWNARMRKWKYDNKEILQNGVTPAVLPDIVTGMESGRDYQSYLGFIILASLEWR